MEEDTLSAHARPSNGVDYHAQGRSEPHEHMAPFSSAEYFDRLDAVKRVIDTRNIDLCVLTDSGNICYLSGYAADSGYVPQGLLVGLKDKYPTLYLRRQDAAAGQYMTFMPNEQIVAYPESFVGTADRSGFDYIFDEIHGERPNVRRIGLEFDSLSAAALNRLVGRMPNVEFVDVSGLVMDLRLIKSQTEISYQREAGLITDHVMGNAREIFKPGRSESEVAADLTHGLIKGLPNLPGSKTDTVLIPGAGQSGTSHITWTDRQLAPGTHYNPEIGAARHNYCVGLMRTISLGAPSSQLKRLYNYMLEGCDEALAMVRPGATCGDVAGAFCQAVAKGGYTKDSRCGYPIGINWLETSCSIRPDDHTVLQENMVFHLMLGMWIQDDFGAVLSETFIVRESGCDVISQLPRDIIVID